MRPLGPQVTQLDKLLIIVLQDASQTNWLKGQLLRNKEEPTSTCSTEFCMISFEGMDINFI